MALAVALTVFFAVGALLTISLIGKPREPLTAGSAAITVLINAAFIASIWIWGV